MTSSSGARPIANVYVDGFNLYYGALRGRPTKWLDLEAWCKRLLSSHHRLNRIHYFTARVTARIDDPQTATRQDAYLRALATLPTVEVTEGLFKVNNTWAPRRPNDHCSCCQQVPPGCKCCFDTLLPVIKTEEKGSDVNLAVYMVRDAFMGQYDTAVIISDDSDLTSAVSVVRGLGKKVIVVSPRNRLHPPLVGDEKRKVSQAALQACQLPDPLTDASGRAIHKPATW